MGNFDSVKKFLNLGSSSSYDDDYDNYDDDYEEDYNSAPKPSRFEKRKTTRRTTEEKYSFDDDDGVVEEKPSRLTRRSEKNSNIVSMNNSSRKTYKAEIMTFKPTSIEDSREIVDALLSGKAIILNFEGTNESLAQRIIDSMIGACCAVNGILKKVSSYIFIVAPPNINLEGDYYDMTTTNTYDYKGRYQY